MTNADRQKAYRQRKRNAAAVTGVTPAVTESVTNVTPRNAETVTALRARVTELEDEVARLKRELATRTVKRIYPEDHRGEPIPVGEMAPVGAAKHGPGCHCFPCWQGRKGGRGRA